MRRKRILLAAAALALAWCLSGCFIKTVDELYTLPKHSDAYNHLQEAIDTVKGSGDTFAAPVSGVNQQSVQFVDLDADGTEEAIVFLKSNDEKPLKAYIFASREDSYELMDVIEGSGTSFDSVEYASMTGEPGVTILLACRLSDEVFQSLGAYAYKDGNVVELMSTNCSEYLVVDLDGDGRSDLFLLRFDAEQRQGVAELYRWKDDQMEREPEASLSLGSASVKRIISGRLTGRTTAVFVACSYADSSIVTDVFAFRGGVFQNITAGDSGLSAQTVRNYYVYASDIDSDGLIELPDPVVLPNADGASDLYSKIIWYNLDLQGRRSDKLTTYHNFQGGWYLVLPENLRDDLTIRRSEEVAGVRGYEFCTWPGEGAPRAMFVIYAFSGDARESDAAADGRFVIARKGDVTYSALLTEDGEKSGLTEAGVTELFQFIRIDWNSGET